ncbi:MAG: NAD(+)/NADH kinase [Anaerolineaceae bacterium]|nr:NAD(+)/NADH kinase [Anaerolineaceae bacterium]
MGATRNAIVFYNEKSGQCTSTHPRAEIEQFLKDHKIEYQVLLVPQNRTKLREVVALLMEQGADLAIVAGGDGTVSIASDLLMPYSLPLFILPLGTGNLLAKELKVPLKLENALNLITSTDNRIFTLDTFSCDSQFYTMNLSVGISSQIMEVTPTEEKKRFGFFAYFKHFLEQLLGLELKRVVINHDGIQETFMASEVMVTNSRLIAINPLEWAEDVFIDDGVLDLFIVRAANLTDIIGFVHSIFTKRIWQNPIVHHFKIHESCMIETAHPLPVQADGDLVGKTPVKVIVHPNSLRVFIPSNKIGKIR